MTFDGQPAERQADAQASQFPLAAQPGELIENALMFALGYGRALVLHVNFNPIIFNLGLDLDLTFIGGELGCISRRR